MRLSFTHNLPFHCPDCVHSLVTVAHKDRFPPLPQTACQTENPVVDSVGNIGYVTNKMLCHYKKYFTSSSTQHH